MPSHKLREVPESQRVLAGFLVILGDEPSGIP